MKVHLKTGLAIAALALSCSLAFAQADIPPEAPPQPSGAQSGSQPGRPMPATRPMNRAQFGRGREGFRQGRFSGMGGMRSARTGFAFLRLLNNPEFRQQVGVTSEQAAALRKDFSDFRKAQIRERADLEIKRIDLQDLLSAEQPDRAAIDSKLEEISASRLSLEKSRADLRLTLKSAISPEQREKMRQWCRDRLRQRGPFRRGGQDFRRGGQGGPPPSGGASGNGPGGASPNL